MVQANPQAESVEASPEENGSTDRIGKYVIINEVGQGSTGRVFLSHDPYYGRDVAIKLYNLANDLAQNRNLAAHDPGRVTRMEALLDSLIAKGRSTPGPNQKNDVAVRRHGPRAKKAP